jgi:hypothetical protein
VHHPAILAISRAVLKILIILNIVAAIAFLLGLILSFAFEGIILERLASNSGADEARSLLALMRVILVISLLTVPLAAIVLSRLLSIVEAVRGGEPFVRDNARRLTIIAWGLLGIQLLDLVFGAVVMSVDGSDGERLGGWTFSMTGWLAVLLLFVLARVFEEGARMRDDIAGTI